MDTRKALTLRGEAGALVKQARGILEKAEVEKRDLNAEEHARFDALHREAETKVEFARSLERQSAADAGFTTPANAPTREGARLPDDDGYISPQADKDVMQASSPSSVKDGWQRLDAPVFGLETRMADRVRRDPGDARPEDLSWGRALRGIVTGDWKGAAAERRSLAEGVGGTGGWLVPSALSTRVLDLARHATKVLQAGAGTMIMDTPEVTIAKLASDPTAYWTAENAAITESGVTFEPLKLKAQTLGVLISVSKELIEDAAVLSSTVESAMSASLALELDRVALFGSGAGEPRGLSNTPGVQTYSMGVNGSAFATSLGFLPFSHACELIASANGEAKSAIFSARTQGQLDRLLNGEGDPLVQIPSYANLDKYASNQVPDTQTQGSAVNASSAYVGDFSQLIFGIRAQIELEASRTAGDAFSKKQTLIRALVRADVCVLRPTWFCVIRGIVPA